MVMPKLIKKVALIFLSTVLFLNSMIMPFAGAFAADPPPSTWYNQGMTDWYVKVYDRNNPSEIFGERYTAAQVQWILLSLFWGAVNIIPGNPDMAVCIINKEPRIECGKILIETIKRYTPLVDSTKSEDISKTASLFNTIEKNPISGINYTNNLIGKFNPVTEVNAQGFGFNTGADSIKVFWQAARNLSYGLIVLAVIIMAFMIMFRVKISPQLVISVQSALPNVIFTTVLITFSYAIAGFAIDLMYVIIGLIASLLTSSGFSNDTFAKLFTELTSGHGIITLMFQYWIAFIYTAFLNIFTSELDTILAMFMLLFAVISVLFILFWSLKIIYVVFKNFAMLMLTIATGPLEILVGAFTGRSSFGSWFKKLLSILVVYPLIGILFFFSFFFLWQGNSSGTGYAESMAFNVKQGMIGDNEWAPPFTKLSGIGEHSVNSIDGLIWLMVSFVIFSQITKVVEIVQAAMTGKPFSYGSAIGEAAGTMGNVTEGIGKSAQMPWLEYTGSTVKMLSSFGR
jgi:hypothetical protein